MRRSLLALLAVSPLAGLASRAAAADAAARPARVVVQVSEADPARWNLALNNIGNLQDELGAANVTIELVAYGPGIALFKLDAPTNARIGEAHAKGITLLACENSMRAQKLVRADMHPNVGYVAAGVAEIVRRQQDGWAYLRP
jgi:intracellular sulfur oxidation DsrE/DsrF family protein